jgi:hypothetical protein
MTRQQGRDGEADTSRDDAMTDASGTARRAPDVGMPGGRAGVDTESVDFRAAGARDKVGSTANVTGGMGSQTGDEDGIGAGADMDLAGARGDAASTGTPQRAGLGGPSSGAQMDVDPAAGSGMANPADMGDQG